MQPLATQFAAVAPSDVTWDRDHCRALLPNLVVAHWHHDTSLSAVDGLTQLVRTGVLSYPQGIGLVQVAHPEALMPSSAARAALAELLRQCKTGVVGSALVLPGEGFRAATARGFATGLCLLVRPPFSHVVQRSVSDAVAWLAGLLSQRGVRANPGALVRAIDELGQRRS